MLASRMPSRRCRGLALLLVLAAVAAATILSLAFLTQQATSGSMAHNIASRSQARMIAESGLATAITYVLRSESVTNWRDHNWRDEQAQGVWVQDRGFAGGTYTVNGEDGEDVDGDGVVDGDGDLSNHSLDLLTLTAVGRYQGAVHTVRAVLAPPKRLLMIVPDVSNLTPADTVRRDLLRDWGWTVHLLSGDVGEAEINQAVDGMHVVYFPAHTDLEGKVKDKLKTLALPIVTGHKTLVKELKIADADSKDYIGTSIDVLELRRIITDDFGVETTEVFTHYITECFPLGLLPICSSDQLLRLDGKILGTTPLAVRVAEPNRITLGILESGALQSDSKPARARRVALPWGKDVFSITSLNENGRAILRRSLDWAGSSWKGFLPGLAAWDKIEIKNAGVVDGFSSALGPYGGANVNASATVSVNSVKKDKVKMESGASLSGSIYIPSAANAAEVLNIAPGATLTGTVRRLSLTVPVATLTEPTDLGGVSGDLTCSTGETLISTNLHLKKLTITNDATVRISGNVTILCQEEVTIGQDAQLILDPISTLTVYTKKTVQIKDNAQVNVDSADPALLNWMIVKGKIEVAGSAHMYGAVQGFDAELKVQDMAHFYGTFVGKKLTVENTGAAHVDTANSGTTVTLGGGMDLGQFIGNRVRWVEWR